MALNHCRGVSERDFRHDVDAWLDTTFQNTNTYAKCRSLFASNRGANGKKEMKKKRKTYALWVRRFVSSADGVLAICDVQDVSRIRQWLVQQSRWAAQNPRWATTVSAPAVTYPVLRPLAYVATAPTMTHGTTALSYADAASTIVTYWVTWGCWCPNSGEFSCVKRHPSAIHMCGRIAVSSGRCLWFVLESFEHWSVRFDERSDADCCVDVLTWRINFSLTLKLEQPFASCEWLGSGNVDEALKTVVLERDPFTIWVTGTQLWSSCQLVFRFLNFMHR